MASNHNEERWYFTKEQLDNSPSRQCGIEAYKELSYRQQAANFIQDLGQRLKVSQLCINTAIVYMHRFYVFHSFTHFPWHLIASAALFLAAKVEEQPRKLEHVIRVANLCKNPRDTSFDTTSERYLAQSQDLVFNENVLIQTLGFDVAIDHPNTHVVKCCHLVRASKDLAQTSYFMASNSLHLTTMCLQYKPTVVACFCIHLACKWSNWEIPLSNEKREWFSYVDPTVTAELLQQLTEEFLVIFERCPSRLKEKIRLVETAHYHSPPLDDDKRVATFAPPEQKEPPHSHRSHHLDSKTSRVDDPYKRPQKIPHDTISSSQRDRDKEREYRDRKERERMAGKYPVSLSMSGNKQHMPPPHGHHSSHVSSADAKIKAHGRQQYHNMPSASHQNMTRGADGKNVQRETALYVKEQQHSSRETATASGSGESASSRDVSRDAVHHVSNDKEIQRQQQRDSAASQRHESIKFIITNDLNCDVSNVNDSRVSFNSEKRPPDISRTSTVKLSANKHDFARKREEHKPHVKLETQDIKKHLSSEYIDNNKSGSGGASSLLDNNSQKLKSPLVSDYPNKTVSLNQQVKHESSSFTTNVNKNTSSSSHFGSLSSSSIIDNIGVNETTVVQPPLIKRPSLFSPEASPPSKGRLKSSSSSPAAPPPPIPNTNNTVIDTSSSSKPATTQELFKPPNNSSNNNNSSNSKRNRTSSSGSEPELRPVMKKIDQVEGFENLMRDSSIGLRLQVPDIITPITERYSDVHPSSSSSSSSLSIAKEMKPPDLILPFPKSTTTNITASANTTTSAPVLVSSSSFSTAATTCHPLVNGIETNPTLISNLLKETPTVSHLQTVTTLSTTSQSYHQQQQQPLLPAEQLQVVTTLEPKTKDREQNHKERKKNKKEKHKHKDKSKEEKEKKKKHKDKEKHKHKHDNNPVVVGASSAEVIAQPIKITIPKGKIQPPENLPTGSGLKIKIPKDRIKTESLENNPVQSSAGQLKIRIPKGVINFNSDGKKRERDRTSPGAAAGGPPLKLSRSSHGRTTTSSGNEPKQNGKNSYSNKVTHVIEGNPHKLVEPKYSKEAST